MSEQVIHKVFFAAEEASIEPWQRALKKGDRFVYRSTKTDMLMWAEIIEDPDPKLGAYRFVRVFCESNPQGEEGDVHIVCAQGGTISEAAWRIAKEVGWPNDRNRRRYESFIRTLVQAEAHEMTMN